jgi:prevent-host-death family protein
MLGLVGQIEDSSMTVVNVQEAKTHLSRLLERVEEGEEVILARAGRPIAKLVPVMGEPRTPGRCRGRITIGEDFDAPLPDEFAQPFGLEDR